MKALLAAALALPLGAHMMSMSSGDLKVEGSVALYELRMPAYEMMHVKDPERSLFGQLRLRGGGGEGKLVHKSCRHDAAADSYICTARYQFPGTVEQLQVECSFHSVTVPNHVHLLRAESGGRRDQAMFDLSFPKATLRFREPSEFERSVTQIAAGMARAAGGALQLLFLASLALAARSRRELARIAGMFVAGQTLAAVILPLTGWQPAPRFVEAALALTLAYLAVEILLLPEAGARWIVAGVLGLFHGLYFAVFLQSTGYRAAYVLGGAAIVDMVLTAGCALLFHKAARRIQVLKPVQVSACALLVIGIAWFFIRLKA